MAALLFGGICKSGFASNTLFRLSLDDEGGAGPASSGGGNAVAGAKQRGTEAAASGGGLVAGAALVSGVAFVRAASRLSSREATTTDHVCFLLALPALGILGVAVCGGGGWMEYHRFV